MRNVLKRFTALLLAIVMVAALLPAISTPAYAATTSDGWTVAAAWSTQSASYEWNSTKDETRQPKIYVTYRLEGATRDYAPGDLEIKIPGIGSTVRGQLRKADKIAADSADSEWTYDWDNVHDVYTFKNKFEIKTGDNVNGGFEFLWTLSSRDVANGFSTAGTPTFTVKNGSEIAKPVDLPELSYRFTSLRDEYKISMYKQNLSASDWEKLDRDYTWYDIRVNYQANRHARGLNRSDTWISFELPEGVSADDLVVMNGSHTVDLKTDDPDHPGQLGFYLSKGLSGNICTYSTDKYFRVGLKATDGKTVTINAHLDRLYLDEKAPVKTATTDYEVVDASLPVTVQSYGFSYNGHIYHTEIDAPTRYNRSNAYYNYQNRLNSANLYNNTTLEFDVHGCANRNYSQSAKMTMLVPKARSMARMANVPGTSIAEDQEWRMTLGLDRISAKTMTGSIRALENEEYDITYVRIPSRADSKTWILYAATDRNASFEDYTEVKSGNMASTQTVNLPADTKAFYILVDGIVGSYSQNVYAGVKFHLDYAKCLADGTLPDPEGNLVAFNSMRALYEDADGQTRNDVAMDSGNYLGTYGTELAKHDIGTHGEYLYRDYDEVFLREPVTKLSTTVSPFTFTLKDSLFTSSITSTGSISADDPGELTNFSAYVELPEGIQIDVDAPVLITGTATDVNGQAVTDFKSHASSRMVTVNGKSLLRVDFNFTDQPLEISKQTSCSITFGAELRYSDFVTNGNQYTFKSYLVPEQAGLAKIAGDNIVTDVRDVNGDGDKTQSIATHTRSAVIYDDATEWREHTNKYVSSQASKGYVTETSVERRDVSLEKQPAAEYSYRLDYNVGALTASNLVFYDRLEQGATNREDEHDDTIAIPSEWQGALVSVDTSRIAEIQGVPTVYYSTDPNQAFDLAAPGWMTEMPVDKSTVKAVAVKVDTSNMTNGVLGHGIPAYVTVNMVATSEEAAIHKKAVNQYTVTYNAHDTDGTEEGQYTLVSNETCVTLQRNAVKLVLQKADANNIIGTDENGNPKYATVYGGEFAVYDSADSNAKPIYKGTPNALGQIVIDPAEYGTYYWEEITAPAGYEKAEGRHEVRLDGATSGKVQYMLNKRLPASVVLTKDDGTYNGYGPLAGAEFELYTVDGAPIATDGNYKYDPDGGTSRFVTGTDGKLTITGLPWGSYYFVETAAPEGYNLSNAKTAFTVGASQYDAEANEVRADVSAGNSEQTASVRLVKKDAVDNEPIDGAMFDLYRKARPSEDADAKVATNLQTDAVGEIQVDNLPFGEYYFLETRNATGYRMPEGEAAKTDTTKLDKSTIGQTLVIDYKNERRTGEVELLKTDDFGQQVKGAVYGLYRGSDKIGEYTTDAKGTIKADKLEWGEYYFIEKSAPKGYAISDEKIKFSVTRENVSNVIYLTTVDSRALGSVQIVKTDADDPSKLLAGAVFELYGNDGAKLVAGTDYKTDRAGNTITTGTDGTVTISGIRQGGYYLVETKSPTGYSLDGKYIRFSVTLENSGITQKLAVENRKDAASIKINKTINDVYKEFGNPTFLFTVTGEDGRCYTTSITLTPEQHEGSAVVTVDAGQKYTVRELKTSRYVLKGITPVTNATTDGEAAVADLTGGNTNAEVTFTNEITKYDEFSHTDSVVNLVTAGTKLTGISVDYKGPTILKAGIEGYEAATKSYKFKASDMVVTAYYDDGTSKTLDWDAFQLDRPQIRSTGDKTATVTVSYSKGGITVTDSFSVGLDLPLSKRYTITINCDGGTIEPDGAWAISGNTGSIDKLSKTLWEDETVNMPKNAPARNKYEFTGWKGSNGKAYGTGDPIPQGTDITITAQWKKIQIYTVKYAVRLYGINKDVGKNGETLGLTFGPAGGQNLTEKHYSSGHVPSSGKRCLAEMSWEEIIAQSQNQSNGGPSVFSECLEKGCTQSVELMIKAPIAGESKAGQMDNGDGASVLYSSINIEYRKWNNDKKNNGGWRDSKIRNTLNGTKTINGTLSEDQCLLAMFPEELRNGIVAKETKSATSSDKSGNNIVSTYDKLWLFSGKEMYKENTRYYDDRINRYEGELYPSQGTYSKSPVFYDEEGNNDSDPWSRSLWGNYVVLFGYYDYSGFPFGSDANNTYSGVAPGFCLK